MMELRQIVERYEVLASAFGKHVPLEDFGLGKQETEKIFSELDEDYHISRFLHFSRLTGQAHEINGQAVTHIAVDAAIRELL